MEKLELKILLIEDNPDFSELVAFSFKGAGLPWHLDIVETGESALEMIKSQQTPYDLMITDYLLPGMDGVELINIFKNEGIDIPVIVLTGQGSEEIAVKVLKMGAYDYLVKDVSSFQILPAVVEKVYKRKRLEKQNEELQQKILQQNQELKETNRNLMLYSRELIKSEKMASLLFFVRGISHELNNPLAGIVGFSELLLNKVSPDDSIREDLEEIRGCAYRIKDIVSKLAKFCSKEKQKVKTLPVNEMIEEVVAFFKPQAEQSKIKIIKNYSPVEPIVEGVTVDLQQALMAILINAREAMPHGGTLNISTRIYDKNVEIAITDTGEGIEEGNLEKIFSPFFTTRTAQKASGLGLAVAYGIIKENRGEIKVQSKVGTGTTFSIIIPLVD